MNNFINQYRHVPDYYPLMYQDGFTTDEILYALKRKMIQDYAKNQHQEPQKITIESEIKIK